MLPSRLPSPFKSRSSSKSRTTPQTAKRTVDSEETVSSPTFARGHAHPADIPHGIKKSPTRSDFPPHLLATINSPNLRPRASINHATRPLPPVSSSPPPVTVSASVPSSPAPRKSSSSALGRCKAKIRNVDRPDAIVVSKPETLDNDAYTPLLPVSANSPPSSPGNGKRQTPIDAPHTGVRLNRALPRMTSSAKTQTPSLPRTVDRSRNSTTGVATADLPRSHLARPTALTLVAMAPAASVQRRRLPSPPCDHDAGDDVGRQRSSRRADASVGTVTSLHSTSAAPTSAQVTPSRHQNDDGRQHSSKTASPQLERCLAPSRIHRSLLPPPPPPPPDVVQSPTVSPPRGRAPKTGGEPPSIVSPVTSRRTAESSPRMPPRADSGLARRTAKPAVDSPAVHGRQAPSPLQARYSATAARLPEDELSEDGLVVREFPDRVTDNRCRDDVTEIDDVRGRCSHVISRHGFGRNSVDGYRRAPPATPPVDGSGAGGTSDRFRRGGPSRSTLPPSLIGTRCGGDGGGSQIAWRPTAPRRGPVVFTDVDVVAVPNHAATSSPTSSGSVATDERHRAAQKMSLGREQRSSETEVARWSASSSTSRIAPPRSSKSKSSSRPSVDKRPTPSVPVCGSEQAKKGERLSNYNKGPLPPSRFHPLQSPPPAEVATNASSGWPGAVPPPPLSSPSRQPCPCGPGPSSAMDTLMEEPDEPLSTAKLKNSPKHRSKLLHHLKLNSPSLRPRTQSMPAGTSRSAAGNDLRVSRDGRPSARDTSSTHSMTSQAFTVDPRHMHAAGFFSSSDSSSPATPSNASGMILGNPLGVWSQKLIAPTDNKTPHSSLVSLSSASSPVCTMTEEVQVQEIQKLRQELAAAQFEIVSLSSHLNTNAQVVLAFEQSLTNMTQRLQQLALTANKKDVELNELRATINSLRQQSNANKIVDKGRSRSPAGSSSSGSSKFGRHHQQRHHGSSDSVKSDSGPTTRKPHVTAAASGENSTKKHKSWLGSFGKALSWRKKRTGSASDAESETSSLYVDASLTLNSRRNLQSPPDAAAIRASLSSAFSLPTMSINDVDDDGINSLQQQLREKELRLTDVQLEALSSAHRLQQMQDAVKLLKGEIVSLRSSNERLNQLVARKKMSKSTVGLSQQHRQQQQQLHNDTRSASVQHITLGDTNIGFLLSDSSSSSRCLQPVKLFVQLRPDVNSTKQVDKILIGQICVDSKADWETLQDIIFNVFKEYLVCLEREDVGFGLSEDSIKRFNVGDAAYGPDVPKPELLPCGYLVGDVNSISIMLKGPQDNEVDSLAFETLIPKPILQRYISLLTEHRRVILCGSSGTGKTFLAHRLAEYIIQWSGKIVDERTVAVFNIDSQSGRELRQYLSTIANRCVAGDDVDDELPTVIILDGLHRITTTPLGDIFTALLDVQLCDSPYIIGTMDQATCSSTNLQLHHNFRWVLCANHMEPVLGLLGRYLRRRLFTAQLTDDEDTSGMDSIVSWLPDVWRHLNRLLETHNSHDVTIGPRLFFSCPIDCNQFPTWFTDLWNYSIVPYVLEAVREGVQKYGPRSAWEDPADWVMSSCPWKDKNSVDWSSLLRIRTEDVGCDSPAVSLSALNCAADAHGPLTTDAAESLMSLLIKLA